MSNKATEISLVRGVLVGLLQKRAALFCSVLLFCLIAFLLGAKMAHFNKYFTYYGGESSRDYLVARHIANGFEFPLVGPPNAGSQNALPNSPAYFYALSAFVLVGRSFVFLNTVTVLLWLLAVWCVYAIGKLLFTPISGLLAAVLYGLHPLFWHRSTFLWQPDIAAAVALAACYFLARGYVKKEYWALRWSVVLISLAAVLHNAVFPLVPVVVLGAAGCACAHPRSLWRSVGLLGTSALVFIFSYAPVWWFLHIVPEHAKMLFGDKLFALAAPTVQDMYAKFVREGLGLFQSFFYFLSRLDAWLPRFAPVVSVVSCVVIVGVGRYIFYPVRTSQRAAYFFLILCTLCQVFAVAALRVGGGFQYLAPAYGILAVLVGESIARFWRRDWLVNVGMCAALLALITVPFASSVVRLNDNFPASSLRVHIVRDIASALSAEVGEGSPVIEAYAPRDGQYERAYMLDSAVYSELERKLRQPVLQYSDRWNALVQKGASTVVYAACYDDTRGECASVFVASHPGGVLQQEIFVRPEVTVYKAIF